MEKKSLSTISLVAMGVGAIMGSGWMFAAQYTSQEAGPGSILSWVIGAILMVFIALVFAEVCTIVPVEGSTSRIPHITHGTMTSYMFAWITWISYLVLAPIEVQAVIQYLAVFYPSLIDASRDGALSMAGLPLAIIFLLGFCVINFYSLKWLAKINNIVTLFKVAVPIFISIVFIIFCFTLPALKDIKTEELSFMPFGFNGVLAAVSVGGIAYAFTGFKTIVELAGSTKNPKKSIPVATVGAVLICLVIFLFLQAAYLLVMSKFVHDNDWQGVVMLGATSSSFGPFAVMAQSFGVKWVMYPLYFGAIVFPLMAGLIYFSIAMKSLGAMVHNGYLPSILGKLSPIMQKPIYAIGLNFLIALVMFAPFPGWKEMATFLTSLIALTYITGPTSTMALRHHLPDMHRPFRLKGAYLLSTLGMFAATLVFLWSGWAIVSKAGIALIIALVMLGVYRTFRRDRSEEIQWNLRESVWFWIYIVLITLVSYFSSFGGTGDLDLYCSSAIVLVISFIVVTIAKNLCLPAEDMQEGIKKAISDDNYI